MREQWVRGLAVCWAAQAGALLAILSSPCNPQQLPAAALALGSITTDSPDSLGQAPEAAHPALHRRAQPQGWDVALPLPVLPITSPCHFRASGLPFSPSWHPLATNPGPFPVPVSWKPHLPLCLMIYWCL